MLQYQVLGVLSVTRDGQPVDLNRPLERRLLAVLLVNRSRTLSDDQIFEALWPGGLPEYPGQALRTSVSRLRKALGTREAVIRSAGGYKLVAGRGSVDADRFEALVTRSDSADRAAELGEALALWSSDDAYADFRYHSFAQSEAERLQGLRIHVYEDLVDLRLASGESDALIADLQFMIKEHPLRERLYGLLMLALYRAGRQAEALRTFQVAKDHLGEEVGLHPTDDLIELEERILMQDPRLDLTKRAMRNNLPSRITSIVGRDAVIGMLVEQLGGPRLVTVTGPVGVGKTTVAIEAARSVVSEGAKECLYVDLASLTDGDQLIPYVAEQLAVLLQRPLEIQATGASLPALLGTREMLLVIDNCEHVIDASAGFIRTVLRDCPNAVVLTTSRERLALPGEAVFDVEPLWADTEEAFPADPCPAVEKYPALALLVERAAASSPGFRLSPDDLPAALRLCRRLDGLPLGIELAAAQTSSLSIPEIESQLNGYFSILSSQRGVADRHRSLEAAIRWSYDLLDKEYQECLQLVAQVNGSFTTKDVQHLIGSNEEVSAAAIVSRLRDKSLVRTTAEVADTTRFEMLSTIRDFALLRAVESKKGDEHRLRHARCFLALASQAGRHIRGGHHQLSWMARCRDNTTDLLQSVETFVAAGLVEQAIDLAADVGAVWSEYRLHARAYPVVRAALVAAGDDVLESTPRVHVIASRMSVDAPGREFQHGLMHAEEAIRTGLVVDDRESVLAGTALRGLNEWLGGRRADAAESVAEACQMADIEDLDWAGTFAYLIAGFVEHAIALRHGTTSRLEHAVELARGSSDEVGEAFGLVFLGTVLKDAGRYAEAGEAFRDGYVLGRRSGVANAAIAGVAGVALASWLDHDPDQALSAADEALEMLDGLTPGAQAAGLLQLFPVPELTITTHGLGERMGEVCAHPTGVRGAAFLRFLLETSEARAVEYLREAQVAEIQAGLSTLAARSRSPDTAVTSR